MSGSPFCLLAKSHYSPVQGKLLAVTWALKKTQIFRLGASSLYVVTDHKPLLGLIKGAEKAENRRLTRLWEELTGWDIHERKRTRISTVQLQQETARDETL